jgi:hypothetical protein
MRAEGFMGSLGGFLTRIRTMNLHKKALTPSPSPIGWERVAAKPGAVHGSLDVL